MAELSAGESSSNVSEVSTDLSDLESERWTVADPPEKLLDSVRTVSSDQRKRSVPGTVSRRPQRSSGRKRARRSVSSSAIRRVGFEKISEVEARRAQEYNANRGSEESEVSDDDNDNDGHESDNNYGQFATKSNRLVGRQTTATRELPAAKNQQPRRKVSTRALYPDESMSRFKPVSPELEQFAESVLRGICPLLLSTPEASSLSEDEKSQLMQYLNFICDEVTRELPHHAVPNPPALYAFQFPQLSARIRAVKQKNINDARLLEKIRTEVEAVNRKQAKVESKHIKLEGELERLLEQEQGQISSRAGQTLIPEHLLPPELCGIPTRGEKDRVLASSSARRRKQLETLERLRILE